MRLGLIFTLLIILITPNFVFGERGTASVEVNGKTYWIKYDAIGLTIDDVKADTVTSTLTISVTTTDVTPTLEITLDRSFFDSKTNDVDDDFLILADGDESVFEEDRKDNVRVLTITVPPGTRSLDIIALGSTTFTAEPTETPQVSEEIPEETVEETAQEEEIPEPEIQCGPGTVLKDGICVLDEQPKEVPEIEETAQPEIQCGPGTVLKDGICVLDERCGPGTIFKDGQCILEESKSVSRGVTFDLIVPAVAAFIIAFIIMIILWAIGRASRKKNNH